MTKGGNGKGKPAEAEETPKASIAEIVESIQEVLNADNSDVAGFAIALVTQRGQAATSFGFVGDELRGIEHTASICLAMEQLRWTLMRDHFQHQRRRHEKDSAGLVGLDRRPLG
jgi:hypothetical protein